MDKLFKLGAVFTFVLALSMFGVMGFASAAQPILKAIPSSTVMIPDGITQYSITFRADSTPLAGIGIKGIQTDYEFPSISGYQFNYVSVVYTPQNDFFAGSTTMSTGGNGLISRIVSQGSYPSDKVGNFATIFFTITQTSPTVSPKRTALVIKDEGFTYFRQYNNVKVTPTMQSIPFTISNLHKADYIVDGSSVAVISCPIGHNC
jgi:hypothetical protein